MSAPDLLGTQGTFSIFTTRASAESCEGGSRHLLRWNGASLAGSIVGPPEPIRKCGGRLRCEFELRAAADPGCATLRIGRESCVLTVGEYSPWIRLRFSAGLGLKVCGVCRFLLLELSPECTLYVTPVNIDPEKPALPISHPSYYAGYLAKLIGAYATHGLAEDTWALNAGVLDDEAFLRQAYDICAEREAMFFAALDRAREGVVACVFDTPDRIQHMFCGRLEPGPDGALRDPGGVIEGLYRRMDRLVDKTLAHVDPQTLLIVLSDHGFGAFRRCVDLNAWLLANGYTSLKAGAAAGEECFGGVDWTRTRAYALGLAGLCINVKGRESCGIVEAGREAEELKGELSRRLTGLRDAERDEIAVSGVRAASAAYSGPYVENAPDLIVAYNRGYRISWAAALGRVGPTVFEDNSRAWSGDHCMDPQLVPGVLFCSRPLEAGNPGLEDLAPTILDQFGIRPPAHMEGRPLFSPHPAASENAPGK